MNWVCLFLAAAIVIPAGCAPRKHPQTDAAVRPEVALYFDREPFISPKIVETLTSWVSDSEDQVVSIDIIHSQGSNRFSGDYTVVPISNANPVVKYTTETEMFAYRLIGTTPEGVHVLDTSSWSGGSGVWRSIVLLEFTQDQALERDHKTLTITRTRSRTLLHKLGDIFLDDRWDGDLMLDGNRLHIGQDRRWISIDPVNGPSAPGNQPVTWTIDAGNGR